MRVGWTWRLTAAGWAGAWPAVEEPGVRLPVEQELLPPVPMMPPEQRPFSAGALSTEARAAAGHRACSELLSLLLLLHLWK